MNIKQKIVFILRENIYNTYSNMSFLFSRKITEEKTQWKKTQNLLTKRAFEIVEEMTCENKEKIKAIRIRITNPHLKYFVIVFY